MLWISEKQLALKRRTFYRGVKDGIHSILCPSLAKGLPSPVSAPSSRQHLQNHTLGCGSCFPPGRLEDLTLQLALLLSGSH